MACLFAYFQLFLNASSIFQIIEQAQTRSQHTVSDAMVFRKGNLDNPSLYMIQDDSSAQETVSSLPPWCLSLLFLPFQTWTIARRRNSPDQWTSSPMSSTFQRSFRKSSSFAFHLPLLLGYESSCWGKCGPTNNLSF